MNDQKPSIFDIIISNKEIVATDALEPRKKDVTPESFFQDFCSKDEFRKLLNSCSKNDLIAFDYLLSQMADEQKFDVTPFEKLDGNNRLYIWISVRNANTSSGFKVLTAGKMCLLINLYGFNLVTSRLSLTTLYEELNKE